MKDNDGFTLFGIGSAIIGLIGILVFSPVITFGFAWFGGWILNCVLATPSQTV